MSGGQVDEETASYSIGDVSEETGITPETLRVWERRYGKPVPIRLPSGHRRYTMDQVYWLRNVSEALASGHRAGKVLALAPDALRELLADVTETPESHDALQRVLELVLDYRGEALGKHLRELSAGVPPLDYLDQSLAPIVRGIGRAWAEGRIAVRHEHYSTAIVIGHLHQLREALPITRRRPRVVLAALEGEWHGIGLHMAALATAACGVRAHVLGVSTPLADIVGSVQELDAEILGISVSLATGGVETDRQLGELRDRLPGAVRIVVGGAGARRGRRGPRGLSYAPTFQEWQRALEL